MSRREIVATVIAVVVTVLVLSMYSCNDRASDRALRKTAEDSLAAAKEDRTSFQVQLARERMFRDLTEIENAGLKRRADSLALRARLRQSAVDSLSKLVKAHASAIPDTATTVPIAAFRDAERLASEATQQAKDLTQANTILRDSLARNDSILKARLVEAADSAAAHLARDAQRDAAILAGVRAGSDRCHLDPFGLVPCLSRRWTFVAGVGATVVAFTYGDEIVAGTKQLLKGIR